MASSWRIIIASPRFLLSSPPSSLSHSHLFPSATFLLRASHWSAYEKNPEEQIWPTVVPDHVIHTNISENYWAPHPETGVFGPPIAHQSTSAVPNDTSAGGKEDSVLDIKAWFRHNGLEDLEKPL
ncbi:late embryogenesis abundant protein At5g17165-like [Benincasa hispida]|uniref:late embryogenesis abundant protein At5g17165-like n=1 Tax=Benincasa hispida TaxID=102211 RepID=UPI001900ECE2|nr:late embryogenesis abundant protein At5g17165-like [Benincasa hispida]